MPRQQVKNYTASIAMNGGGQRVSVGTEFNAPINAAQSYTIATKVRRTKIVDVQSQNFMGNHFADKFWVNFMAAGGNEIRVYHSDLTPAHHVTGGKIVDYNFHTIVATYAAGSSKIYIDGTLDSTVSHTGTLNLTAANFYLAGSNGFDFFGNQLESAVASRAWTADEVMSYHVAGTVPKSNLLGYYPMQEGTGTTAYDSSGNANHAAITGATWSTITPTKARLSGDRQSVLGTKCSVWGGGATPVGSIDTNASGAGTVFGRIKVNKYAGDAYVAFYDATGTLDAWRFNVESGTGYPFIWTVNPAGTGQTIPKFPRKVPIDKFFTFAAVLINDGTNVTGKIYIDGQLWGAETAVRQVRTVSKFNVSGVNTATMSGVNAINRELTAQEIMDYHTSGKIPNDTTIVLKQDEGAQNTMYDSSGNNFHATGGTLTWLADSPSPARRRAGELMLNGSNTNIPPFVAPTTTNQRWVTGDAAGSSSRETGKIFGFAVTTKGGSSEAYFDKNELTYPNSRRVSTTATGSYIEAHLSRSDTDAERLIAAQDGILIPVKPGVSYTLNFMARTNLVSGASSTGAFVKVWGVNGNGAIVETFSPDPMIAVQTSTPWTLYTKIFTPGANTRYVDINQAIYGHVGAGTMLMDLWLANISVVETANIGRVAVT